MQNLNPKLAKYKFVLLLLTFAFFLLTLPQRVEAFRMSNDFFILILGNLNSIAGQASGGGNKLTFTSGELGAGLYTGTNYTLCAGFYGGIECNKPTSGVFTFTVSPTSLDFGTIDPTYPVSRNNTLTITSPQNAYTVTASEDKPLTASGSAATIPNTTCDNGLCSNTTADLWTNTLTYGFGYRCDNVVGTDCSSGFSNTNYYKQFSLAPLSAVIMSSNTSVKNSQSTVTYKINISGSQIPGVYTNTITYIASPNF